MFTPSELTQYLKNFKKDLHPPQYSNDFFKSVSFNGTITADEIAKIGS